MKRLQHCTMVITAILSSITALSVFSKEEVDMNQAVGTFEVKVIPQTVDNNAAQTAGIGRNAIEKQLKGDIEGVSHAEMLYSGDPAGYGSYVAIEKVSGSVKGRSGSFVLMHSGVMNQGKPELWNVRVVPGSGTGQLQGLSGTMTIIIAGSQHSYDFAYTLSNES
jgi:hypothetical protein